MIRAGDRLFFVAENGNVSLVEAAAHESKGQVDITGPGGFVIRASTANLFRSEQAANRAAVTKGKVAAPTPGLFVRPPP